jgi:hypothetical protein
MITGAARHPDGISLAIIQLGALRDDERHACCCLLKQGWQPRFRSPILLFLLSPLCQSTLLREFASCNHQYRHLSNRLIRLSESIPPVCRRDDLAFNAKIRQCRDCRCCRRCRRRRFIVISRSIGAISATRGPGAHRLSGKNIFPFVMNCQPLHANLRKFQHP